MKIIREAVVDSTNRRLLQLFREGKAKHETVLWAGRQTAGRCRGKGKWSSPDGDGLYASLLLTYGDAMLPLETAVAVCKGLERLGFAPKIKWPNDILLEQKKICGILCESVFHGSKVLCTVCGFGINVNNKAFPVEIEKKANSLYLASGKRWDNSAVLEAILAFWAPENSLADYRKRCMTLGKSIFIAGEKEPFLAVDLGAQGQLMVQDTGGNMREILYGEVSIRGLEGYV